MTDQLVSAIIPSYNHSRYLKKAIDSVLKQSYKNFEIIVVDDGSTDDTRQVVESYDTVKYIYQKNQGLSAARNTGIKNSTGNLLVFLDADDWLLPDAFSININFLTKNPKAAFVSGAHLLFDELKNTSTLVKQDGIGEPYCHFLAGNYIGMHAAVMYQRWVFNKFKFSISMLYCEDYDLYLRISRKFPVIHHIEPIAVYRKHDNNMSANFSGMLNYTLLALHKQKRYLSNDMEKDFFAFGLNNWRNYYTEKIYTNLINQFTLSHTVNLADLLTLKKNSPEIYARLIVGQKYSFKQSLSSKLANYLNSNFIKLGIKQILSPNL